MSAAIGAVTTFFLANGMVFELLISATLFTWWIERRRDFPARCIGGILLMLAVSQLWYMLAPVNFWTTMGQNFTVFALLAVWMYRCWRLNGRQALFYFVMAGTTQHLVFRGARMATIWPHIIGIDITWLDTYGYALMQIPFYILAYLIFARPMQGKDVSAVGGHSVFFLLVGMTLCVSLFTNLYSVYGSVEVSAVAFTIFSAFDFVTSVFMLELAIELVSKQRAHAEGEMLRQMLRQQKQQLESDKETIELINIKTHDLKKQIAQLGPSISPEQAEGLSSLAEIYDSSVHTGNDALDVLLTQKSLLCEQHGIQFDRMVDGRLLGFMDPADIYSLVGNALDNAMEAVEALPEGAAERYIAVRVSESKGMVMIRVENPFVGELEFDDGLPRTTKDDARYHGFGMRSIRMIAERYRGYIAVAARNGLFRLTVILPLDRA